MQKRKGEHYAKEKRNVRLLKRIDFALRKEFKIDKAKRNSPAKKQGC